MNEKIQLARHLSNQLQSAWKWIFGLITASQVSDLLWALSEMLESKELQRKQQESDNTNLRKQIALLLEKADKDAMSIAQQARIIRDQDAAIAKHIKENGALQRHLKRSNTQILRMQEAAFK